MTPARLSSASGAVAAAPMRVLISRPCVASSSRLPALRLPSRGRPARALSFLPRPPPLPFFTPPPAYPVPPPPRAQRDTPEGDREIDDREWEMRVARAMLHLRETLPRFFDGHSLGELFPPDVYSRDVVLKLPAPIPVRISSLQAYTMTFSIARSGMQAFHGDLHTTLERITFTDAARRPSAALASRQSSRTRQIRVQVSVHGVPRFPPHKEATWQTSSLYSFCPRTGLVATHEVETVRPLPGEGVAEWLLQRLLGRRPEHVPQPCRAVAVPVRAQLDPRARRRRDE